MILLLIYTAMKNVINIFYHIVKIKTLNYIIHSINYYVKINIFKKDYYEKLNFPCDGKTLDSYNNTLTLEGCMKHPTYNKSIEREAINVGATLFESIKSFCK